MKFQFRFAAIVFAGFCQFFAFSGCETPPPAEEPAAQAVNNDVWALLARGDGKARGYFLGEVDVHAVDERGRTPLHYAAELQDANLAAFFISLGANANAQDKSRQTPLGISAEKRDAETAKMLASGGADIHLPAQNGESPARTAVREGGAFLRSILTAATVDSADGTGQTVLHMASAEGSAQAVRDILAASGAVDTRDNAGKTALDLSLSRPDSRSHMEAAEILILAGGVSDNDIYSYFAPAVRSANYNARRADGMTAMHYAAGMGYEGLIEFLVEKNADVNIKNNSGAAPLHEAARSGNVRVMRTILDQGANVNTQDAKGNTPLHIGVPAHVHKEAIDLFLSRGANPNLRDEHGESPLHIVVTLNRSPDIVQTLLDGSADSGIRNIDGKTPLYLAVEDSRENLISLLVARGTDVFAADNQGLNPFDRAMRDSRGPALNLLITEKTVMQNDSAGNTMLHAAVKNTGSPEIIGRILDYKAQVNARNKEGDNALHLAVRLNQKENGELLISRGADIFAPNAVGESPLYLAFASAGGARRWMVNPQTLAARDGLGNSILHYLAQWKFDSYIPFVVDSGVSANAANATGETPLFAAVKFNGTSTIKTLLNVKANLNARDSLGNSALHAAVRWNAAESALVLLAAGIDINAHSLSGKTPLHDAVRLGITNLETLLIEKGAALEVRDAEGNTPFMEAVAAGYTLSIERLAEHGADPMTRNIRGDTPLHIAVAAERSDLVNPLLRMGVSIHARNTRNRTPFQNALHISPRLVSTLLTKDRINSPDDFGNSALHVALEENVSADIIRIIIAQGCRLTAVDSNGRTPLRRAADAGAWETAKLLADAGSDPFSTASDGKTPAEVAIAAAPAGLNALFSGRAVNAQDASGNTILHYAARVENSSGIALLMELGAHKGIKNIASESPYDIAMRWNMRGNAALLE